MTAATEFVHRFEAMASEVTIRITGSDPDPTPVAEAAEQVFADIERTCTRFDPDSPLMRANRAGSDWSPVPTSCLEVLQEAHEAYRQTTGRFDPRVLAALSQLGYDRSFGQLSKEDPRDPARVPPIRSTWAPEFRLRPPAVRIGPDPVDLGGIGKGIALRRAARLLRAEFTDFLIEAGGDCFLSGVAASGEPWSVAVEDPLGGDRPRAVLAVSDQACATSSTRLRAWNRGEHRLHHLIDPRTGRPADGGLASVTVLHPDPARAEVLTKVLFLSGRIEVAAAADELGVAALWIDLDGRVGFSERLAGHLLWRSA